MIQQCSYRELCMFVIFRIRMRTRIERIRKRFLSFGRTERTKTIGYGSVAPIDSYMVLVDMSWGRLSTAVSGNGYGTKQRIGGTGKGKWRGVSIDGINRDRRCSG